MITNNNFEELLLDTELRMEAAIEHLHNAFLMLRTGGANPAILERLRVDCYGGESDLIAVASISAPDKRNLIVRPFDTSILPDIEKAILKSKIGLTPLREGKILRLPVPPLSEERCLQLVKEAKAIAELQRVAIRNIRRDTLKAHQFGSDDDKKKFETSVDALTKLFVSKVDECLKLKSDALLNIENRWGYSK